MSRWVGGWEGGGDVVTKETEGDGGRRWRVCDPDLLHPFFLLFLLPSAVFRVPVRFGPVRRDTRGVEGINDPDLTYRVTRGGGGGGWGVERRGGTEGLV